MHLNKIAFLLIALLACSSAGCYRYSYGYSRAYPAGYRIQPYSSGGVVYGAPYYGPTYAYPAQRYAPVYYGPPAYYGPGPGYYGGGGYGYHHHHGWHHR